MPSTRAPVPRSAEALSPSLDERIQAAEQRIIERDERFRAGLRSLSERSRQTLQVWRRWPLALGAGVVVALWRLLRHSPAGAGAAVAAVDARHVGAVPPRPALPWAQWLALAWPLLPAPLRTRLSPATAAVLASVALPVVERAFRAAARPPPPATMAYVDLARCSGRWFELARSPAPVARRGTEVPSAQYAWRGSRAAVTRRSVDRHGRVHTASSVARVVPGSGNARLELSRWPRLVRALPFAWADRWILHVDASYQVALIGDPNRRFLWVLSRHPELPAEQLQALIQLAAERGYPVDRLQLHAHRQQSVA